VPWFSCFQKPQPRPKAAVDGKQISQQKKKKKNRSRNVDDHLMEPPMIGLMEPPKRGHFMGSGRV